MVNRLSSQNQFEQAEASLPPWEDLPRAGEPVDGFANGAFVSATGLVLPTELDFDEWKDLGTKLVTMRSGNQWALGDWWAYGHHKYGDRKKAVKEAGVRLHYKFNSLMNLATISRKFPPSFRNEVLTFTHHKVVATLPPEERSKWLSKATGLHWSVEKLQKAIHEREDRDRNEEARDRQKDPVEEQQYQSRVKATDFIDALKNWKDHFDRASLPDLSDDLITRMLEIASKLADRFSGHVKALKEEQIRRAETSKPKEKRDRKEERVARPH